MITLLIFLLTTLAFILLQNAFQFVIDRKGYQWFYRNVYLRTPHWRFVRWIKRRLGYRCRDCDSHFRLDLHHLSYDHKWWEFIYLNDVVWLCRQHHFAEHERLRYAKQNKTRAHAFPRLSKTT